MGLGPFSEILDLEQDFYEDGFQQGLADGEAAGQSEGRTLGLEKGFEKFCESGRLYGRSLIWANQLSLHQDRKSLLGEHKEAEDKKEKDTQKSSTYLLEIDSALSTIQKSQRLSKSIKALHGLVEPETLSFENTEEAVSDFDDRLKRARAKFKLIEKLIIDSQTKIVMS